MGGAAREGLFLHLYFHVHIHRTSPPPPAAPGSNTVEKARRGEGQCGIWPSLTEKNWELPKEGVLPHTSLLSWSRPSPQSSRRPLPTSRMRFHPNPSPLPSLVFTPLSLHCLCCCRLSPLPRVQAPFGVALSSTFSEARSSHVQQTRWVAGSLLPYGARPSPTHAPLSSAYREPLPRS